MTRTCPLCGASSDGKLAFPFSTRWRQKLFSYLSCHGCGTTYVDPVPDESDFEEMYRDSSYHSVFYADVATEAQQQAVDLLGRYITPGGSVLDYGCGNGSFLLAAARAGYACQGTEHDEVAAQKASLNAGVPVMVAARLEAHLGSFDAIHLGDVLEHLPDPSETMGRLRSLLKPAGVFLVEGPLEVNPSLVYWCAAGQKKLRRLLGLRDAPASHPPFHLFLTNAEAQQRFFEQLALKKLHFSTSESGWPYLQAPAGTVSGFIKRTIGRSAIWVSHLSARFGNRFIAVYGR